MTQCSLNYRDIEVWNIISNWLWPYSYFHMKTVYGFMLVEFGEYKLSSSEIQGTTKFVDSS